MDYLVANGEEMKAILHLCADIGSDSYQYSIDNEYCVIKIGADIGVENYIPDREIHGIIANPPCTEFSRARVDGKAREKDIGFFLVDHCIRIINESNPAWWVIENPATGTLKNYLGKPIAQYEPWWYGSPWTKKTALWGHFQMPERIFFDWNKVQKNSKLYIRPGRTKPSLAFLHKSAINLIPEFKPFKNDVRNDMDFRSLCSQKFAAKFKESNP